MLILETKTQMVIIGFIQNVINVEKENDDTKI